MSSANITNHLAPELTRQTALQDGRRMSSSAALVMPSVVLAVISFAIYTKVVQKGVNHILKRFWAWIFLFKGIDLVQAEFDKAKGQPFEVLAPDNRYVFVSSPKHIDELDKAPDGVLSMEAATKHMLQPQYTMYGFNWFDHRGTEGVGFIKALRTMLTNNLPNIVPNLTRIVNARLEQLISKKPLANGSRDVAIYPLILNLVVLSNAVSFFGEELAKNEAFMTSALDHIEQTLICAEILKLLPKALVPLVGKYMATRLRAHEIIFNTLLPVAQQRCLERDQRILGHQVPTHNDCIQWILDTSPRQKPWSAERVIHEIIAIWFGSVHAVSTTITFALHDLCIHPEYREPLREELQANYASFEQTASGLPLLDSFVKESARLSPIESQSTRRAALKPFTFSDGTTVHAGDWACTPARAIMQRAEAYPEPLGFHGFRFVDPAALETLGAPKWQGAPKQDKPSKLTDVDSDWLVWGTGRMKCPGRFYASAIIKVILAQILLKYDCNLVEETPSRYMTWRTTMIPKHQTMVRLTPCTAEAD